MCLMSSKYVDTGILCTTSRYSLKIKYYLEMQTCVDSFQSTCLMMGLLQHDPAELYENQIELSFFITVTTLIKYQSQPTKNMHALIQSNIFTYIFSYISVLGIVWIRSTGSHVHQYLSNLHIRAFFQLTKSVLQINTCMHYPKNI